MKKSKNLIFSTKPVEPVKVEPVKPVYLDLPGADVGLLVDFVRWHEISSTKGLSETFIRVFKDHVNWVQISRNQALSESFIEEFKGKVCWANITYARKTLKLELFSADFIRRNKDKCLEFVLVDQPLTESFIEEMESGIDWKSRFWELVCRYQPISESFMRKHEGRLCWGKLSERGDLSEEFIEEYEQELNWCILSKSQTFSENFIRKFSNRVDWSEIRKNHKNLSNSFIIEFKSELLDW